MSPRTTSNRHEIHFEAGPISINTKTKYVCPYLLDVEPGDLEPPLDMFQAKRADKEGTQALVSHINKCLGEGRLPDELLFVGSTR